MRMQRYEHFPTWRKKILCISLLTISHMMGELERSTGRRVDLIEDGCLLPFAVESANRDKRLIYERSG